MKKLIVWSAAVLLALGLTACDTGSSQENGVTAGAGGTSSVSETITENAGESTSESTAESTAESTSESDTEQHLHHVVIDPAVEPTCVKTGLTEGSHCKICGEVLNEQTILPAKGEHHYGDDGACTMCGARKPTEGLEYKINEDDISYSVVGIGTADATEIVIADIYEGLPVTGIGDRAFFGCDSLTAITIPDSVICVGISAFSDCTGLIQTDNGVEYVDKWVINCDEDVSTVSLRPDTVGIAYRAFYRCALTDITIPDSVTSIGHGAFSWCESLTSVTLHAGLLRIDHGAFNWCYALTDMTIPDTVIRIGEGAFNECTQLIQVDNGVQYVDKWVVDCDEAVTAVSLRSDTVGISDWAFKGCNELLGITIPDGVVSIGEGAFSECVELVSIIIPDCVTSIGQAAFEGCTALTSVSIGHRVTSIGLCAFASCESLTDIVLPAGLTRINSELFGWCDSLTSITFMGTSTEWEALPKGVSWDTSTPTYTIHCTDGTVSKDGTVTPN